MNQEPSEEELIAFNEKLNAFFDMALKEIAQKIFTSKDNEVYSWDKDKWNLVKDEWLKSNG